MKTLFALTFILVSSSLSAGLFTSSKQQSQQTQQVDWDAEFEQMQQLAEIAKQDSALGMSLGDIVESTKHNNYETKAAAERVFRARANINMAIGNLMPSLNFQTVLAGAQGDFFDMAASLIGFAFPSNWFKLDAKKSEFEAERYGYAVMLANQVNTVEVLFYRLQLMKSTIDLYETQLKSIAHIFDKVTQQVMIGEQLIDHQLRLDNLMILLEQDKALLGKAYAIIKYNLAFAIGLPPEEWNAFEIHPETLLDLSIVSNLSGDDIVDEVVSNSLELKEMMHLVEASKSSAKGRQFEFLSPGGQKEAALGFGYASYVAAGKSKTKELQVKETQFQANLHRATYKAVEEYNNSLTLFELSSRGAQNEASLNLFLERQYEEGGIFNSSEVIEMLISQLDFKSHQLQAQINNHIATAQIKRLTFNGDAYGNLMTLVPSVDHVPGCFG